MAREQTHQKAAWEGQQCILLVPTEAHASRAGVICGLLGGPAMAIVATATLTFIGRSLWFPINLVAATVLRNLQTASPDLLGQFIPLAFVVGLAIHLFMFGSLFSLLFPTKPGTAFASSTITGLVLWAIVQFITLPLVNRIMSQRVKPVSFVTAQVSYSLVPGWWVVRYPIVPVR